MRKRNRLTAKAGWSVLIAGLLAGLFMAGTGSAQTVRDIRKMVAPDRAGHPYVEERGMIRLDAAGKTYEKRFVIRYPEAMSRWNGRLLIAAHGGSGGVLRSRSGQFSETSETALDDVIGMYALEHGYAYASVDRDGIGGAREGLALVDAFTGEMKRRIQTIAGRPATRVYLTGLSAGGAITRYASEDPQPKYDGVIIIAGGGGSSTVDLERQAQLVRLWPLVDPVRHPDLPLTDPNVKTYARLMGTPPEARAFWPFVGAQHTVENFRRALEQYGLTGLTDAQVQNFRMKDHAKNTAFMDRIAAAQKGGVTGQTRIPTIEVVGNYDDIVMAGVLEYKNRALELSRKAPPPTPADRHRLYQVEGAWHISSDDDAIGTFQYTLGQMGFGSEAQDQLGRGSTYRPTVEEALGYLDRWVSEGKVPPPDQKVWSGQPLK